MAHFKLLLLLFGILPLWSQDSTFNQKCFVNQGREYTLLRVYDDCNKALIVDTQTLETKLLPSPQLVQKNLCKGDSNYEQLRLNALTQPQKIANRGIKEGMSFGYAVTVDMCPSSKKGFEKAFYEKLIQTQKAYPVTISMTQKWAIYHPKAWQQLKAWDDEKLLSVTWMNHGSMHPYERGVALEKNFINIKGIDFDKEVLDNERFLIQEGRVPSIFYRYAGLVSNDKAYAHLIKDLGLIPVGSLAWLAKGESIKSGSIVLLHGNKNEPLGIERFLKTKTALPVVDLPQLFIKE